MRLAVLMYHALYRGEDDRRALAGEEQPYAVSEATFIETLDLIHARGGRLHADEPAAAAPADRTRVLISFDDGHRSNYRYAFPLLAERGIRGLFFVTSDFIGRRAGFCTWLELGEMAAAGMGVHSHGMTHRFLDSLDERDARRELADSKSTIEDRTGREVTSISFPGGRFRKRELRLAREIGYRHCYSSRFGTHRRRDPGIPFLVRRIAVRSSMSAEQTAAYALGETWPSLRRAVLESVRSGARRMLGNDLYHALYRGWAGWRYRDRH